MAAATAIAIVLALAWRAGGYFPTAYLGAGAVAFAVLGGLLALRPPHYALSSHALLALGALGAFAVWIGLSSRWSSSPLTAIEDMQRALVYVGLFGLGLVAAGSGRFSRLLVWGALGAVLVIVGAGLVSRLYPDLIGPVSDPGGLADYRLGYPLGYWNAFGALAAMGVVLALGLGADPRSPVPLRSLAAGAAVLMSVAMYLSLSRGAWLALFVGLAALIALGAHRGSLILTSAIVTVPALLAIARLGGYPALVDDPHAGSGQLASGHAFAAQLALLVAGAVAVQAVVAAGRASDNLMQAMRRVVRPLLIGLLATATLGAAITYVVRTSAVEGRAARAVTGAQDWVDRQWQDFLRPTTFSEGGTARLTSSKGTRSDLYRAAVDGFDARPLIGDGAGGFEVRWMRERRVPEKVRDAHSLYLETLGELGLVGAALLALFLASLIVAAVRQRVRPGALARSQAAAVGGACAVWLSHCAVDWDWQMPAVTGVALLLAATLYPAGRRTGGERPQPAQIEK